MIGKSRWLIVFLLIMFLAGACTGNKVYDRYVHTPVAGWEKNDTLVFCLSPMAKAGQYEADLGLRITTDYPFMGLTLIVDQMICPSNVHHVDTLSCKLIDERGNSLGVGLSYYQYHFPISTISLREADSIVVRIRHDMKREILPGISDIGYQLRLK